MYYKTAVNEAFKQDSVSVNIISISDGRTTDQSYDFFGGENKRPYQARKNVTGNAVFMLFLEKDVHELQRQTGGSWRHFRYQIRWALAACAVKSEVLIRHQNKAIKGTQYSIQPYAQDDKSERCGIHANKYYIVTLSNEIPGTIYQVRSVVPEDKNWKESDELISEESITFTGFTPEPEN